MLEGCGLGFRLEFRGWASGSVGRKGLRWRRHELPRKIRAGGARQANGGVTRSACAQLHFISTIFCVIIMILEHFVVGQYTKSVAYRGYYPLGLLRGLRPFKTAVSDHDKNWLSASNLANCISSSSSMQQHAAAAAASSKRLATALAQHQFKMRVACNMPAACTPQLFSRSCVTPQTVPKACLYDTKMPCRAGLSTGCKRQQQSPHLQHRAL